MISTANVSLQFGKQVLFEDVSITFAPGNCYGLIGANGSGKSSFLKILSGDIDSVKGDVILPPGKRLPLLKQDHFQFDKEEVLKTVLMGHKQLFNVMQQKELLYAKSDFSEEDGIKISELEAEFETLDGWSAEADAAELLSQLGIPEALHSSKMQQLTGAEKVRVLLVQALFGDPDVLLLDEPTNHLDLKTILWLENFLYEFKHTVIVVSHDRHFLDKVCTHVADIDFGKIQLFSGNFSFWQESSQLISRQLHDSNKKIEDQRAELQSFIKRFSANASKSKQATSRKRLLEKLTLSDIKPSSRKYPGIVFKQNREAGNNILTVENLNKEINGKTMFKDVSFTVEKNNKIAFVSKSDLTLTALFETLAEEISPDSGKVTWGISMSKTYLPKDNNKYFDSSLSLIDWLRQYSQDTEQSFIRGFLGRMLFSGEETFKKVSVLSGGEKVRCMLSRMMLQEGNILLLNEPTNHLDLEAIEALNKALTKFPGCVLFSSHDHTLLQTVANRIIYVSDKRMVDYKQTTYDEYLEKVNLVTA